jgi:hypothetical protein
MRLYKFDDNMINEYGAVGGAGEPKGSEGNLTQCYFFHHK